MPAAVDRVFNFSAGPAVLPLSVLEQAQRDLLALPGVGSSILEISHRGKAFESILAEAEQTLRSLLGVPASHRVLFLQGGSRLQFSMIPMNLLPGQAGPADYIVTGSWGKSALEEAQKVGPTAVPWDGAAAKYDRLPRPEEIYLSKNPAYVHFTSNETIQGVQFAAPPEVGDAPLVCDMSSDFLSRPVDVAKYGLIYACAQKNAGPAGVTVVIVREDLLARGEAGLPGYLNYRNHAENSSMWNTPPTFAVYLLGLVGKWLQNEVGGLANMAARNEAKADLLYQVIDVSQGFYRGHARPECRSRMNVTFRLPGEDDEKRFLSGAKSKGLVDLKGHRSVGGIRASIYNAMPVEGVAALADFMRDFAAKT